MAWGSKKIKTEHGGAKHGGSGFYGHHQDAKRATRKLRRRRGKQEVKKEWNES